MYPTPELARTREIVLAEDPGKRAVAASTGEVAAAEAIDDRPLRRDIAVLVLAGVHPVRHASTAATCNGAGKRLQVVRERHAAWQGQPAVGVLAHALPVARECRRCGAVAGPAAETRLRQRPLGRTRLHPIH